MGTLTSITNRIKSDRRDVSIHASISASDADTLDDLVTWLGAQGAPTTRSSLVRALLLDTLQAFREQLAEADARSTK